MSRTKLVYVFIFTLLSGVGLPFSGIFAQKFEPIGIILEESGVPKEELTSADTLYLGDDLENFYSAPVKVLFKSQIDVLPDTVWRSEWRISGPQTYQIYDDDTEISFDITGTYEIRYFVTFIPPEGESISFEDEDNFFTIRISESLLKVPNAFSPNGDGKNDIFKVHHRSLVKFNAYVFNRWGQQIYHWNINNIDEGWDGTYKGKPVKDGVYFIFVEAEGSDGAKYSHKGDINILRGYSGTGSNSGSGSEE